MNPAGIQHSKRRLTADEVVSKIAVLAEVMHAGILIAARAFLPDDAGAAETHKGGTAMLQTIGFLGCLLLAIKGLELLSSRQFKHHTGERHRLATIAAMLALGGALIFALVLHQQGLG